MWVRAFWLMLHGFVHQTYDESENQQPTRYSLNTVPKGNLLEESVDLDDKIWRSVG
jgi:hypothetical protein